MMFLFSFATNSFQLANISLATCFHIERDINMRYLTYDETRIDDSISVRQR